MCTHVCVGAYMPLVHLCVNVCGGQRTTLPIFAKVLSALFLETGSFTDLELTDYLRLTVHWWPSILTSQLQRRNDENHSTAFLCRSGWSYLCPHIHEAVTYKLSSHSCLVSVHSICNGFIIFFKPSHNVLCLEPVPCSIGTMKKAMENFWGPCFTLALIPTTSNKRTFIHRQTTHGIIRCHVICKQIFPSCNQKLNLN